MRKVLEWVVVAVVAIALEDMLSPWWGPVLGKALPTVGTLIQSIMAGLNERAFTIAIRYTAGGYREPGDVLLTFMVLVVWLVLIVWGLSQLPRPPRPITVAWKRHAITALMLLGLAGVGYFTYLLATEVTARSTAMQMYKLYERKMAAIAPYISPQEARELGSQWARMDTRADLQAVDARLQALLRQHGLISDSPPAATP